MTEKQYPSFDEFYKKRNNSDGGLGAIREYEELLKVIIDKLINNSAAQSQDTKYIIIFSQKINTIKNNFVWERDFFIYSDKKDFDDALGSMKISPRFKNIQDYKLTPI